KISALIHAPGNIFVEGEDFHLQLGLSDGFKVVSDGEPNVYGTVEIRHGNVSLFGRDFKLQEGSKLDFTGPLRQPELDVTANHVNVREDVTITVAVHGRPPNIEIQPSSNPPMSDTEIYTLLATGRRASQAGPTATGAAGSPAVSALGGV